MLLKGRGECPSKRSLTRYRINRYKEGKKMGDRNADVVAALIEKATDTFGPSAAYAYVLGVISAILIEDQIDILEARLDA